NPKRSSNRRGFLFLATLLMFGAPSLACNIDLGDWNLESTPSPRLGTMKKVIFSSGCSTSLNMAVGSSDTMTITEADSKVPLPSNLEPKSSDPTVIEIQNPMGVTFDVHALKAGTTDLQVWTGETLFDSLTFQAEPVKAVKFSSEPAVLAGGRTWVVVTDMFGACGKEDCPLFGHGFMQWSVEPATSFTFLEDQLNIGHYRAGTTPGMADLVGHEPSEGGELVRHQLEIVDPATITGISGTLKESKLENDKDDPPVVDLPAKVRPNNSFEVRVFGARTGKNKVAISRHDIEWTLPTGMSAGVVVEPSDIYGSVFTTTDKTGDFTLTAKIGPLGGQQQQFVVTVAAK
ncbi:MAG TPA: hypothetical protein PK156_36580, partial [Polyangium sp.]|nr:hypothetical protein [Polyangium sp.]